MEGGHDHHVPTSRRASANNQSVVLDDSARDLSVDNDLVGADSVLPEATFTLNDDPGSRGCTLTPVVWLVVPPPH